MLKERKGKEMEETKQTLEYYEGAIDAYQYVQELIGLYNDLNITNMELDCWLEAMIVTKSAEASHEQANILSDMERSQSVRD